MSVPEPTPPRVARRLARVVAGRDASGRTIQGDLHEAWHRDVVRGGQRRADWRYRLAVLRLALTYRRRNKSGLNHVRRSGARRRSLMASLFRDVMTYAKGRHTLSGFVTDWKLAWRSLRRTPGSAAAAVATLGMGIGLTVFALGLVHGTYGSDMAVEDKDGLRIFGLAHRGMQSVRGPMDFEAFRFAEEASTSFSASSWYHTRTVNLTVEGLAPVRLSGAFGDPGLLSTLGVRPAPGRGFLPTDGRPGEQRAVVIAHDVWAGQFASDPSIIGLQIRLDGTPAVVVGIAPTGFGFPVTQEAWIAEQIDPGAERAPEVLMVARLRDGARPERALEELNELLPSWTLAPEDAEFRMWTVLDANLGGAVRPIFIAMLWGALFVLLIACANVANLLATRSAARSQDVAVRVSLGAGRCRIAVPELIEAVILAAAGTVVGLIVAQMSLGWFDTVTAHEGIGRPYWIDFGVDRSLLWGVIGILTVTTFAAAGLPAWVAAHVPAARILRGEGRPGTSRFQLRLGQVLVVSQLALSCALLVGAGMMVRSIVSLSRHELPMDGDRLLTGRVSLPVMMYSSPAARQQLFRSLLLRLSRDQRVEGVGLTDAAPGSGNGMAQIEVEGSPIGEDGGVRVFRGVVSSGYFATTGVRMLRGRGFDGRDTDVAPRVAVINEPFERRFFSAGDALGQRFRLLSEDETPSVEIIGIVPDLRMDGFPPSGEAAGFYVPHAQVDASALTLVLRVSPSIRPNTLTGHFREAVLVVDPDLPVYDLRTLDEVLRDATWFIGAVGTVFIAFGAVALLMASVGLYGVVSFHVGRRRFELGLRQALGARPRTILWLVLRGGGAQILGGLALGLGLGGILSHAMASILFEVEPGEPVVYVLVAFVLALAGGLATVGPALRALGVPPHDALSQG